MSQPLSGQMSVDSLPTLSGNGIPAVLNNFSDNSFNPTNPPTPYSNLVQTPSNLVGTSQVPYQPVALPNYIATLYANVFNINSSLTNNLMTAASDNRVYPTAFAVQQYVQSQISGTQLLGTAAGQDNGDIVNTTVNNSIILGLSVNAHAYNYAYVDPDTAQDISAPIYVFNMDTVANNARNGANKQVILSAHNLEKGTLVYLYSGNGSAFMNAGEKFSYYQFTHHGAFIDFTMIYDEIMDGWCWFVTNHSSSLSVRGVGAQNTPPFEGATPNN
jgi:hypothetical protein